MLKTVIAIEQDGMDIRVISLLFDVPSEEFDLSTAVKSAATDFCKTPEGMAIFKYNCSYFNWADFAMSVPSVFCEKHGFKKVDGGVCADMIVNWDEQLVDDFELPEDSASMSNDKQEWRII